MYFNFDYSWGPALTNALPASLPVYFTKFLMKRPAKSWAFPSQTFASAYVSRGSKIAGLTPGNAVGTSKLKYGTFLVSAFKIEPSKIASMIGMLASQAVIYDKLLNNIAQYGDKNLIDKCNSDINSVFACEE